MTNINTATDRELPSSRALLRSTIIAAATAVVLLVTAVLPAEYGVDPTGIGRLLGLTQMGEIKMQLAKEAAAAERAEAAARPTIVAAPFVPAPPGGDAPSAAPSAAMPVPAAPTSPTAAAVGTRADTTRLTLRPNESGEVKLVMRKGARAQYAWSTDGGGVSFETHGDTLKAPPGVFHSYSKGRDTKQHEGAFVAVFDGMHGWFWRNRTRQPVTITLRTSGAYEELKRLD
jgi:hypothetical protein